MTDDQKRDIERDEYKATIETYRFFVNLRFVTVVFAMTLQAGLFALYERVGRQELGLRLAIAVLAEVLLIAIFVIEWRTTSLFHDVRERGRELERQLGIMNGMLGRLIKLGKDRWWGRRITHTFGVNAIYMALLLVWLSMIGFTSYELRGYFQHLNHRRRIMSDKKNDQVQKVSPAEMSDDEYSQWANDRDERVMFTTFTVGVVALICSLGAVVYVTVQWLLS